MNIYKHEDYRKVIISRLKNLSLSQREIANKTNIHVAYFSRVLKGELGANFSEDQIFAICPYINIENEDEIKYLILLLQYERSGSMKYKKYLKNIIKQTRHKKLSIKNRIAPEKDEIDNYPLEKEFKLKYKYFQKWYYTEVYLLASIPKYRKDIELIAKAINMSLPATRRIVDELEEMGLLKVNNKIIKYLPRVIHMGEGHSLSSNHHLNWRTKAIEDITHENNGWHFTVGISTNKKTKEEINKRFKDFVHEVYLLTRETKKNEETLHICIDLF